MSIQKKFKSFLFLRPFLCLSIFFSATLIVWGTFYYEEHQTQKTIELERELRFVVDSLLLQFPEEKLKNISEFLKEETVSFERLESFKTVQQQLQKVSDTRSNFRINFFQYVDAQHVRLLDPQNKLSKYSVENSILAKTFEKNATDFFSAFDKNSGKKWTLVKIIQDAQGYPLLGLEVEYLEPWNQHIFENALSFPSLVAYFFFISISLFLYFYFRWLYFNENRELKKTLQQNLESRSFGSLRFYFVDSELPNLFNNWMRQLQEQWESSKTRFNALAEEKNKLLFQQQDHQRIKALVLESRANYWVVWDSNGKEVSELSYFREMDFGVNPHLKSELATLILRWKESDTWVKKNIQSFEIKPLRVEGGQRVFFVLLFFRENKEEFLKKEIGQKEFESTLLRDALNFFPAYLLKAKEIEFLTDCVEQGQPFKKTDKKNIQPLIISQLQLMLSESHWAFLFPQFQLNIDVFNSSLAFPRGFKKEIGSHPLLKMASQMDFQISLSEWREKIWNREEMATSAILRIGKDSKLTIENIFFLNSWVRLLTLMSGSSEDPLLIDISFQEEAQGWTLFEIKLRGVGLFLNHVRKAFRGLGELKVAMLSNSELWSWMKANISTIEKAGFLELAYLLFVTTRWEQEHRWFSEFFFEEEQILLQMIHTPRLGEVLPTSNDSKQIFN